LVGRCQTIFKNFTIQSFIILKNFMFSFLLFFHANFFNDTKFEICLFFWRIKSGKISFLISTFRLFSIIFHQFFVIRIILFTNLLIDSISSLLRIIYRSIILWWKCVSEQIILFTKLGSIMTPFYLLRHFMVIMRITLILW
jgi:hypothetical protein